MKKRINMNNNMILSMLKWYFKNLYYRLKSLIYWIIEYILICLLLLLSLLLSFVWLLIYGLFSVEFLAKKILLCFYYLMNTTIPITFALVCVGLSWIDSISVDLIRVGLSWCDWFVDVLDLVRFDLIWFVLICFGLFWFDFREVFN